MDSNENKVKQNYKLEKICKNCCLCKTAYLPVPGREGFKVIACKIGEFTVEERGTCDLFKQI